MSQIIKLQPLNCQPQRQLGRKIIFLPLHCLEVEASTEVAQKRGRDSAQNDPSCATARLCRQTLFVWKHLAARFGFPCQPEAGARRNTQSPCDSAASNGANDKSFHSGSTGLGDEACQNRWEVFTLGSYFKGLGRNLEARFVRKNKIETLKKDRR